MRWRRLAFSDGQATSQQRWRKHRARYCLVGRKAKYSVGSVARSERILPLSKEHPASPEDREALYKSALVAGRMGAWETDLLNQVRTWSPEGQALFGLNLPDGRGTVGGDDDEYMRAIHPDDRHLVGRFHSIAHQQDTFVAEYRILRPDGSVRWVSGRGQVMDRGPDGSARRLVSIVADVTERKEAEERVHFLLREMSHRSKNLIAVIQAIANRTIKNSTTLDQFSSSFDGRLKALGASHDLLVRQNWHLVSLDELVRGQLSSFMERDSIRLEIHGPEIFVNADTAQAIGLAMHELGTNAAKYGALSVPAGKIAVRWTVETSVATEPVLVLEWAEIDGPAASPPSRKGFGHIVIDDMITRSLGARVRLHFPPTGLVWTLVAPLAKLTSDVIATSP